MFRTDIRISQVIAPVYSDFSETTHCPALMMNLAACVTCSRRSLRCHFLRYADHWRAACTRYKLIAVQFQSQSVLENII